MSLQTLHSPGANTEELHSVLHIQTYMFVDCKAPDAAALDELGVHFTTDTVSV